MSTPAIDSKRYAARRNTSGSRLRTYCTADLLISYLFVSYLQSRITVGAVIIRPPPLKKLFGFARFTQVTQTDVKKAVGAEKRAVCFPDCNWPSPRRFQTRND